MFMDITRLIGETTEYDKKAALETKRLKSWCKSVSAFANEIPDRGPITGPAITKRLCRPGFPAGRRY